MGGLPVASDTVRAVTGPHPPGQHERRVRVLQAIITAVVALLVLAPTSLATISVPWAVGTGGTGTDQGSAIATLPDGSAIVTGRFQGTATFGSTTLTSAGGYDVFVAKVDASGTYAWATGAGGASTDIGYGVSALPDGSVIVTGNFNGTATFGSTSLTSAGADDVFVAKVDASGSYVWAARAGGGLSDIGYGVSALADGSAVLTGRFQSRAVFGSTTLTSSAGLDMFVAKVDASGSFVWATSAGGSTSAWGNAVSTHADGSAVVTGLFDGTIAFGSTTFTAAVGTDAFIAKVGPSGSFVWARSVGGGGSNVGRDVSTLADGSAIVSGSFENTASLGSTTLTGAGILDVFVAKVDASGTFAWATGAGGTA